MTKLVIFSDISNRMSENFSCASRRHYLAFCAVIILRGVPCLQFRQWGMCAKRTMRTKCTKRTIWLKRSASAVNKGFQPSRTKRTKRTILENLFLCTKTSQVSLYYIYYIIIYII